MAHTIIMPKAGMAMEEGTVVRWLKKVGETIYKGEAIAATADRQNDDGPRGGIRRDASRDRPWRRRGSLRRRRPSPGSAHLGRVDSERPGRPSAPMRSPGPHRTTSGARGGNWVASRGRSGAGERRLPRAQSPPTGVSRSPFRGGAGPGGAVRLRDLHPCEGGEGDAACAEGR